MDLTLDELFETSALLLEAAQAARLEAIRLTAEGKHARAAVVRERAAVLLSTLKKVTAAGMQHRERVRAGARPEPAAAAACAG